MKIYTKTGDKGTTGLAGGERVEKFALRIQAYGTVDETNACVGLVRDLFEEPHAREVLLSIQTMLFNLGSHLATQPGGRRLPLPELEEKEIEKLEKEMDRMDEELPPLRHFILPGGHPTVSHCHLARTVCRRAERLVVELAALEDVSEIIYRYLNRLSDYLFVLARYIGHKLGVEELKWMPQKSSGS